MIELIKGDCLIEMQNIADGSIDCIICDLPYGTTACKWDSIIPFEPLWKQYKRIIKDNGAIILFAAQPFTSALIMSNPSYFKYDWIWNKKNISNPMLAKYQPLKQHEIISLFNNHIYKPIKTDLDKSRSWKQYSESRYTNSKTKGNIGNTNGKYPKSIIEFSNAKQKNKLHPTQKPVALLEYLIKTYTNENDTVLDFTMGSGSTGVACKNLNRNFIGIEKDEKYFDIAKQRIEGVLI